jgi:hypothetical protein
MTWSLKHRTRADGRRDRLTVDASGANTRALKMRQKTRVPFGSSRRSHAKQRFSWWVFGEFDFRSLSDDPDKLLI